MLRSIATVCLLLTSLGAKAAPRAGGAPKQPSIAHDGKAIALWQNDHRKRRLKLRHATKSDSGYGFGIRTK